MAYKVCKKCGIEKPNTKDYFKNAQRCNKDGVMFNRLEKTCKKCANIYMVAYKKRIEAQKSIKKRGYTTFATLDNMIDFAQSLGFKSASYAIDKYGKEQFKQMYYDNTRT